MTMTSRFEAAAYKQGFEDPLDESPLDTPDGWFDGSIHQTGNYIMARIWRSWDGRRTERHDDIEYECGYGENPGVSITRYVWDDEQGTYVWDGEVTSEPVNEGSDAAKAAAAKRLMEEFNRESHQSSP